MTKPFLKPYAIAILGVGGAALASWLLHPLVHEENLTLFLVAVIIAAMFGSMRAALLATLLSVLVVDYLFDHPTLRLGLDLRDAERAFVFSLVAVTVSRLASTRKTMLARLSETNAELQAIFDHIPVMLAFVGEDGRLKLVNREWERALGWSLEEIRSRDLDIFAECYPDAEYRRYVLDFIEKGKATWGDFKTRTRDGRTIDTLWANVKLSDGRNIGLGQDFTDRKRAEEKLRETERKYRDIFENAGEGIFQTTPDGKYIAVNPALARMHGCRSPEELINDRQDISHEVYVDPARREEFKRLLETEGVVRGFEHEIFRRDGSKIWVSVNARAVCNENGVVRYYEGTAQDITERKRAEAALRESEELFSKAFHSTPSSLIITRLADGRFLNANDAFLAAFEYERAEVIGQTVATLNIYVGPGDRGQLVSTLQDLGTLREYESQARTKSGRILDLLVCVEPVTLKGEQCLLSTAYDITERKRVEHALRESEERYRDLVENSHEFICTHDMDGLVLSANRAAADALGYDLDDFVGKRGVRDILAPEVRHQFEEYMVRVRRDHATSGIMVVQTSSGERRLWEFYNSLRTEGVSAPIVRGIARDITERKRAEESLKLFRNLLDQSGDAIEVIDPVTLAFIDCNESAYRSLGYSREEFLSLTVFDIDPLADQSMIARSNKEIEEAGFTTFESIHRRKDGTTFPVEVNVKLVSLARVYRLAVVRDITGRKRAEKALRESEERYRELFENAKDAFYVHDLSGRYTSVNRAAEKLSGYSRAEIIGKHYSNFMAPSHLKHARTNLVKKLDEVPETNYEIDLITKDRRRVPVEVSSRLIYENGVPVGVQGTARDITERQLAEQARAQLALIVESSHDAIIGKTLDGTIVSWNSGAAKIYGYLAEEVIGRSVSLLIPPERRDELPRIMEILRRGESIKNYETTRRTKGGNVIDVSLTISPIRDSLQNLVGAATIARDITSSKQAEKGLKTFSRRLIEAQEAERQSIARELHDEIGQVLTAVRINLQSIQRSGLADQNNPRFDESVAIVDEALGRVRDLSIELRPSLLDDLGLYAALRWYVDRYAQRTGIIAEVLNGFEEDGRLPRELETACFRIAQEALTNVARHAQAGSVSVQLERSWDRMFLTVMDDGVGFDLDSMRKNTVAASALGLRGMEERALAVGGHIEIDSGSGHGTRVRASFPLRPD
jgi:PAS domain S-box-containing protein